MLAAAIIVFREVVEAGLIVGIVLAATQGVPARGRYVAGGIAAGILGAALLAMFAGEISTALEGMGQEVFNAAVLALAVVMLSWHNVWMARHGRELAAELKAVGQAVVAGNRTLMALAAVVAIAVLREGAEVVLFLYGIVVANGATGWGLLAGGLIGIAAGGAVTALTYFGLVKIPARYLFGVTSILIAFVAAGMASQCVAFLQRADVVSILSDTLWNTSATLPVNGLPGRILQTLLGYDDQPSILQGIVYLATLAAIFIAMRVFAPEKRAGDYSRASAPAQ
jgi:high-affinity iron transporter